MDEYQRILDYLNSSPEHKAANLQQVFEDSIEFFHRFRHVLKTGTPEEQEAMLKTVNELRGKLSQQVEEACEKTGYSREEIESLAVNPSLFSEEQWRVIESSREEIDKQARIITDLVRVEDGPGASLRSPEERHRPTKKKKKKKWVKS